MLRWKDRRTRKRTVRLALTVVLAVCAFVILKTLSQTQALHAQGGGSLQIINVQASSATVERFEKLELTFDVTGTVASNLDWPYDPDPPPGLPSGVGITVDGLFSPDNWTTVYTQSAFLYQPYTYTVRNGYDHLYPAGDSIWKVRFAPPSAGAWRYRIQATDASGTTIYPVSGDLAFTVVSSSQPGFLHVSPTDPRYFEFDDGSPFVGVGHGEGFDSHRPIQDATEKFARFAASRANFFRVWMTGDSIFGSAWWPWTSHHLEYEGYIPPTSLAAEEAFSDGDVSMELWAGNPCMFQGFIGRIPVLPERSYRVRVRVKAAGVTGPAQAGEPYGFVVKQGGWLGQACSSAGVGIPVTPYLTDTGGAWQIFTGTLTTDSGQYFIPSFYLTLSNATGGVVYVDEVWLEEELGSGQYGPNLVRKPKMNAHTYFDPYRAWQWDHILDRAAAQGVYLKLVILEKGEWIFNHITPLGTMTTTASNNNFYAGPDTKVRWLHQAWWRYLTARWGYSTAVHSWELLNEGDPFNGNHYNQAQAFAQYIHEHDPNSHMVTTSFWHSFPMDEFWANPVYPDVDYADLHAYVSTGWGRYAVIPDTPPSPLLYTDTTDFDGTGWSVALNGGDHVHSAGLWGADVQGDGEWLLRYRLRLEGWSGSCDEGDTLSGPRLTWWMDGKSNVVPPREDGVDWRCSTPIIPVGWVSYDSAHTAEKAAAPLEARILITDSLPHHITIGVQNNYGIGGIAYFDAVELIAPNGTVLAINGDIELDPIHEDAALYTSAYSLLRGGKSPAGARMPLVRGESGLDHPGEPGQGELEDLAQDVDGVWLHNFVWGGINPGGMYDLYWWTDNIRDYDLYYHYTPYRDFMDGIPLNNGCYQDAGAVVFHPDLRVWGQKDTVHGRAHLWIQNRNHTWRTVVDGVTVTELSGRIIVPGVAAGLYQVEWWNTYTGAIMETELVGASPQGLVLGLPAPLSDDVAVKVSWMGPSLGLSTKTVNRSTASPGDVLTYTITVVNAGTVSVTATMTDEIPTGTTYVPHSASVTPDKGDLDNTVGIRWGGELGDGESITITFAVRVEPVEEPFVVSNVAAIESGSEHVERRALTIVNAHRVYLPLILRGGR
jgi:uncharacterized repeat protein (TIGR01451 family)